MLNTVPIFMVLEADSDFKFEGQKGLKKFRKKSLVFDSLKSRLGWVMAAKTKPSFDTGWQQSTEW